MRWYFRVNFQLATCHFGLEHGIMETVNCVNLTLSMKHNVYLWYVQLRTFLLVYLLLIYEIT